MNNKKYIRDEILFLIARYQNEVRGLSGAIDEETDEMANNILKARKYTYEMKMIPDLKRLLWEDENGIG